MAKRATATKPMPENNASLHPAMHETQENARHAANDLNIHDDAMPENWKPPGTLDAPEPRPGMVQRWVRWTLVGHADAKNRASQHSQGWRPRSIETVQEGDADRYPTVRDQRFGDVMVSGDLVLAEMPLKLYRQMQEYYKREADKQVAAMDADTQLGGSRINGSERHGIGAPHVAERSSSVTTRKPIVAAD